MKEVLVNQLVSFEFSDKCLNTDSPTFVQPKLQINSIVRNRTIYNVIVVG